MKLDRILSVLVIAVIALAAVIGGTKWSRPARTPAEPPTPAARLSLLVVGVDGLDLSIVERLSREGRLPNLTRLMAEGATGVFANLGRAVPLEISWTSLASGAAPQGLGVGRPTETSKNKATETGAAPPGPELHPTETLWTILSARGSRVAVLNWPATWPAEEVNGVMVGPYVTYVLEREHSGEPGTDPSKGVYPASERAALDPLIRGFEGTTRGDLSEFVNLDSRLGLEALVGKTYEVLAIAVAGDHSVLRLARRTADDAGIQNMFVFLSGLDSVTARFWHYAHPVDIMLERAGERNRGLLEGQVEALGATIDRYYEATDAMIGELMPMVRDDGTVAIIASHGYVGLEYDEKGDPRIGANMWSDEGLWILKGPRSAKGARTSTGTLLDVAPTIAAAADIVMPPGIDGKVWEEMLAAR
jgi:hypothetical protein